MSADNMGYDPAFEPTILPGIVSSAGILFFGVTGNALLIGRVFWGIPIAVCLILAVAFSISVDIWVYLISRTLPGYRSTIVSECVSIGLLLYRVALLVLYTTALAMFRSWLVQSRRIS